MTTFAPKILHKVAGGWINPALLEESKQTMITQERRSRYKHKVMFTGLTINRHDEIQEWCKQSFGPGGRSKKLRWRFGWTDKTDTYYFKSSKDAMLFTLRWSGQ